MVFPTPDLWFFSLSRGKNSPLFTVILLGYQREHRWKGMKKKISVLPWEMVKLNTKKGKKKLTQLLLLIIQRTAKMVQVKIG